MTPARNRRIEIVVRALILQEDHLLVTQWRDGYAFPIGGRVKHGESLECALHREVREEIDVAGRIRGLLYLCENSFGQEGDAVHEFGWYYLFETERSVCEVGEVLPNPDHPDLSIHLIPLADLFSYDLRPQFLRAYLPRDVREEFVANPRHLINRGERCREVPAGLCGPRKV